MLPASRAATVCASLLGYVSCFWDLIGFSRVQAGDHVLMEGIGLEPSFLYGLSIVGILEGSVVVFTEQCPRMEILVSLIELEDG